jgi:hypothetical protein
LIRVVTYVLRHQPESLQNIIVANARRFGE